MTHRPVDVRRPWATFRYRVRTLCAVVLAAGLAACASPPATHDAAAPGTTFILVRHAEKAADDPRDPSLLPAGEQRARRLAELMRSEPLHAVYATPFRRTRATAAPSAQAHGLQVRTYDAAQPAAAFAAQLRREHREGSVLVVGHSNTVPALAAALCACPVEPMPDTEYGRRYRLTAQGDAPARLEVIAW